MGGRPHHCPSGFAPLGGCCSGAYEVTKARSCFPYRCQVLYRDQPQPFPACLVPCFSSLLPFLPRPYSTAITNLVVHDTPRASPLLCCRAAQIDSHGCRPSMIMAVSCGLTQSEMGFRHREFQ